MAWGGLTSKVSKFMLTIGKGSKMYDPDNFGDELGDARVVGERADR